MCGLGSMSRLPVGDPCSKEWVVIQSSFEVTGCSDGVVWLALTLLLATGLLSKFSWFYRLHSCLHMATMTAEGRGLLCPLQLRGGLSTDFLKRMMLRVDGTEEGRGPPKRLRMCRGAGSPLRLSFKCLKGEEDSFLPSTQN